MRCRLFKPGQRTRLLALGLGTLNSLALAAGCSGQEFTAGDSSGASGGAGAGGDSNSEAGESGSPDGAPNGGSGGDTGSGGSAGKPVVGCDCLAGEYCQDGTNDCQKCADFTRFVFGPARKLTTLSQGLRNTERFARPGGTGSQLFYVTGAADKAKLWYTTAPVSGPGAQLTLPTHIESGPLLAPDSFADANQNLFFDRLQAGERKLMMVSWTALAIGTDEALVPEPINEPGADDYSIAISPDTGHVYWMSTRNGQPELLWQATRMSDPPAAEVLDLKLKAGKAECARSGEDATPWVNMAGTLLLFSNPSVNDRCEANDSGASDLFAAPLNEDGTAKVATAVASLNHTGGRSRETDPSLSSDSCTIYFSSDDGTGDFDLYKAQRN
jgi:hypothetical protein